MLRVPTSPASPFLARAVADARAASDRRAVALPIAELRARAADQPPARGFRAALAGEAMALVAEVKRSSPSRGKLRPDLDAAVLAAAYQRGGAAAVSVLTEPVHFDGSPSDLLAARAAVEVPLLRKDFVTVPYQVWEARAWGADAVLLIVAALVPALLDDLLAEAATAGLDALVEVHTEAEAAVAAAAGAALVGVNARDLASLRVDTGRLAQVAHALPAAATVVAESGISTRADVVAAAAAGADAVLVGESLVRSDDPAAMVAGLLGRPAIEQPDAEARRPTENHEAATREGVGRWPGAARRLAEERRRSASD
jgi:indole-3-glycerol phosphate synthase